MLSEGEGTDAGLAFLAAGPYTSYLCPTPGLVIRYKRTGGIFKTIVRGMSEVKCRRQESEGFNPLDFLGREAIVTYTFPLKKTR
jgi:hypothetical protein